MIAIANERVIFVQRGWVPRFSNNLASFSFLGDAHLERPIDAHGNRPPLPRFGAAIPPPRPLFYENPYIPISNPITSPYPWHSSRPHIPYITRRPDLDIYIRPEHLKFGHGSSYLDRSYQDRLLGFFKESIDVEQSFLTIARHFGVSAPNWHTYHTDPDIDIDALIANVQRESDTAFTPCLLAAAHRLCLVAHEAHACAALMLRRVVGVLCDNNEILPPIWGVDEHMAGATFTDPMGAPTECAADQLARDGVPVHVLAEVWTRLDEDYDGCQRGEKEVSYQKTLKDLLDAGHASLSELEVFVKCPERRPVKCPKKWFIKPDGGYHPMPAAKFIGGTLEHQIAAAYIAGVGANERPSERRFLSIVQARIGTGPFPADLTAVSFLSDSRSGKVLVTALANFYLCSATFL